MGSYDVEKLQQVLDKELEAFLHGSPLPFDPNFKGRFPAPEQGMKLYRVTYHSVIPELGNRPTIATGLVAIPEQRKSKMPVVSYQHGTVFGKMEVPSEIDRSMETKLMLAAYGAQGYVVIAADYFGLGGTSKEPNSYFARRSNEQACMDMYSAAMKVLNSEGVQPAGFFVKGWSQGAYNTMLYLRKLEEAGIEVTAAATASTPVDPLFFIVRGLNNPRPIDAVYEAACMTNMLFAQEYYNGIEGLAKNSINPKYYQTALDFYDFKIDWMQYRKGASDDLKEVFTSSFYSDSRAATAPFWQSLYYGEAYRWISVTPLRAYSGKMDEVVPDYAASLGVLYQAALGKTNGEAISAGDEADHRATYIFSLLDAKPWFDSFLK
jgi:pimeloyl-ACP methyl ester carboxylesterase